MSSSDQNAPAPNSPTENSSAQNTTASHDSSASEQVANNDGEINDTETEVSETEVVEVVEADAESSAAIPPLSKPLAPSAATPADDSDSIPEFPDDTVPPVPPSMLDRLRDPRLMFSRGKPIRSNEELGITPSIVSQEVNDYLREQERRRRLFPRGVMVGIIAGLVAVAFRDALEWGESLRNALIVWAGNFGYFGWIFPVLLGVFGTTVAVLMVQNFAPEASGSGIPHLKAVLHRLRPMRSGRIIGTKFVGGALALGGGLALGREGPTVQMGGAIGQVVHNLLGGTPRERQSLIAAGAGAGLAAAFNAPLAGVVFVIEEVQRDFSPGVFTTTFLASVTADVVTRTLSGQLPVFHLAHEAMVQPLESIPAFALLGLTAGGLGVVFNRALLGTLNLVARFKKGRRVFLGAAVGALVGLVAWYLPGAVGGGNEIVESTLKDRVTFQALAVFFVLRFGLTMISYGTGAPGGIFAPLLVLGAQIGLAFGQFVNFLSPRTAPQPMAFAVVGMAAYFSAIVRAPLTGVVLLLEMTEQYALMLPLLVACFMAYLLADMLGDRPIYEALLERDLLRSQENPQLEETMVIDLTVEHDSKFANCAVGDLNLPAGCLILTVTRGISNKVAHADTILEGGDRLTALVSPEAASAVPLLRDGCASAH